jgi:hypothetical protein
MRAPHLLVLFSLFCTLLASPAKAEQQHYDLRLAGLRLGSLIYVADTTSTAYATRILFETAGLAGLLTQVRFEAQASGRGSGRDLSPQWAQETTRRDGSTALADIRWTGPQPRITREEPPEPDQLDPAEAHHSVDLATGLHAMFRNTDAATACDLKLRTYDGKRLLEIEMGERVGDRDRVHLRRHRDPLGWGRARRHDRPAVWGDHAALRQHRDRSVPDGPAGYTNAVGNRPISAAGRPRIGQHY